MEGSGKPVRLILGLSKKGFDTLLSDSNENKSKRVIKGVKSPFDL